MTYEKKYELVDCRRKNQRAFRIKSKDNIPSASVILKFRNNEWTVDEYGCSICTEFPIKSVDELRLRVLNILKQNQPQFFRKMKIEKLLSNHAKSKTINNGTEVPNLK